MPRKQEQLVKEAASQLQANQLQQANQQQIYVAQCGAEELFTIELDSDYFHLNKEMVRRWQVAEVVSIFAKAAMEAGVTKYQLNVD